VADDGFCSSESYMDIVVFKRFCYFPGFLPVFLKVAFSNFVGVNVFYIIFIPLNFRIHC
jgi:hypothetical protein